MPAADAFLQFGALGIVAFVVIWFTRKADHNANAQVQATHELTGVVKDLKHLLEEQSAHRPSLASVVNALGQIENIHAEIKDNREEIRELRALLRERGTERRSEY